MAMSVTAWSFTVGDHRGEELFAIRISIKIVKGFCGHCTANHRHLAAGTGSLCRIHSDLQFEASYLRMSKSSLGSRR